MNMFDELETICNMSDKIAWTIGAIALAELKKYRYRFYGHIYGQLPDGKHGCSVDCKKLVAEYVKKLKKAKKIIPKTQD